MLFKNQLTNLVSLRVSTSSASRGPETSHKHSTLNMCQSHLTVIFALTSSDAINTKRKKTKSTSWSISNDAIKRASREKKVETVFLLLAKCREHCSPSSKRRNRSLEWATEGDKPLQDRGMGNELFTDSRCKQLSLFDWMRYLNKSLIDPLVIDLAQKI